MIRSHINADRTDRKLRHVEGRDSGAIPDRREQDCVMESIATRIYYRYCDAANFKFRGSFVVEGNVDLQALRSWMCDEEFFIPDRIGLKNLVPNPRNSDDHDLHSIEDVEPCESISVFCSAEELAKRMKAAFEKGWFTDYSLSDFLTEALSIQSALK